ncbi:MAG: type I-E CRISPR-associated protein Cse1/CasA [Dehalococcoidia bacterium]|nr:type I-E CRISPR-associated protein Cse1/CasA [Dehalococcoidia bacterium]
MSYNLIDEQWIPVLWNDGRTSRVGIREILTQAHRIRALAASNPMDRLATLRFLLALLYWCKGSPSDKPTMSLSDSFPPDWFKKLDDHADCFDLLGEKQRFYQYRGSADKVSTKLTANYLIHEIPTGTNKWHFRHSTDGVDGLCQACCAMGLLRFPVFATSGGRGKPPGINTAPPFYVMPVGISLAATLRLSWLPVPHLGTPAWEKPDIQLPKTGDVPLLTGLTWLPRRVWLDNPDTNKATCVSCGRVDHLIRLAVFAGVGSTRTDSEGPSRTWHDPHVLYDTTTKARFPSLRPANALASVDTAAGQWAGVVARILQRHQPHEDASPPTTPAVDSHGRTTWVVGFATKKDKYFEAIELLLPVPTLDCPPEVVGEKLLLWQHETANLAYKVRSLCEKPSSLRHPEIASTVGAIRPQVESTVAARVDQLVGGSDEAWQEAAAEYRPAMDVVARALSPGFTAAAVRKRSCIVRAAPDVRLKPEPPKKGESK